MFHELLKMKISTEQIFKFLHILSWIIFIGLCVEAGVIIFNAIFTRFVNENAALSFYKGMNLSSLYNYDSGYFLVETTLMSIMAVMKAIMFYLIVKILHDKKLNLSLPFNIELKKFISKLSYLALGIGLLSFIGVKFTKWLVEHSIQMPDIQDLKIDGAGIWLFMFVILFVIAQIFKRGIEIQAENDLTI